MIANKFSEVGAAWSATVNDDGAYTCAIPQVELRVIPACSDEPRPLPMLTPRHAADFLRPLIGTAAEERFAAVYLDGRSVPIAWAELARGESNVVHVSPRSLFRLALALGSSRCIIAHNHPTGDPLPSEDDLALTERVRAAGQIVGIDILDHVIVTAGSAYYSTTAGRLFR